MLITNEELNARGCTPIEVFQGLGRKVCFTIL